MSRMPPHPFKKLVSPDVAEPLFDADADADEENPMLVFGFAGDENTFLPALENRGCVGTAAFMPLTSSEKCVAGARYRYRGPPHRPYQQVRQTYRRTSAMIRHPRDHGHSNVPRDWIPGAPQWL